MEGNLYITDIKLGHATPSIYTSIVDIGRIVGIANAVNMSESFEHRFRSQSEPFEPVETPLELQSYFTMDEPKNFHFFGVGRCEIN